MQYSESLDSSQLLVCRGHAAKAAGSLIEPGRKAWDTVKPLHKWFKHLHRVLLLDDDAGKVWQAHDLGLAWLASAGLIPSHTSCAMVLQSTLIDSMLCTGIHAPYDYG